MRKLSILGSGVKAFWTKFAWRRVGVPIVNPPPPLASIFFSVYQNIFFFQASQVNEDEPLTSPTKEELQVIKVCG
jgi:hypothetical protein